MTSPSDEATRLGVLASIERAIQVGLAAVDRDGRQSYVSPAFCRMTGFTEDELVGAAPPFVYWPADERDAVDDALAAARCGRAPGGLELCLQRKGGTRFRASIRLAELPDGGWLTTVHELGEESSEHAPPERFYRLTHDLARAPSLEALYEIAADGIRALLGVERTSLLLFDDDDVMRFKSWRGLSEEYRYAVEGHSPWRRHEKNPAPVWVSDVEADPGWRAYLELFRKEGIRALGFVPLVAGDELLGKFMLYYGRPHRFDQKDITVSQTVAGHVAFAVARRVAEDRLARRATELATIADNTTSALLMLDRKGRCTFVNAATAQLTGYATAELRDRWLDVLLGDANAERPLARALREEVRMRGEDVLVHRDGHRRDVAFSVSPILEGAERAFVGTVVELRDVSAEKRAAEALKLADRRKDEFLAILGHELRNPLAPILTAVQLMGLKGAGMERERAIIERQVRHLERLVDDLLDVSRITRGKVELRRARVDLADVVAKAVEMTSPLFDQRRHALSVEVPREALYVDADPVRLAQVVGNLLTNAARYTEPEGSIAVTAAHEADQVVLRVKDSGVGIARELLSSVFEPFVQAPQPVERSQGGLGLGLTIVRSLVDMHGGSIAAHSDGAGRGTTMTVRLPALARPSSRIPTAPCTRASAVRGRRVLVVDDNRDAAEMVGLLLGQLGHDVTVAFDGPSALEVALSAPPEVAFLDIGLPVMDGYELAERLRAALPDGAVLVAVTGYGQDSDRDRALAAGFQAHLVKPVALQQLLDVLGS